jgi:hypothetical protein
MKTALASLFAFTSYGAPFYAGDVPHVEYGWVKPAQEKPDTYVHIIDPENRAADKLFVPVENFVGCVKEAKAQTKQRIEKNPEAKIFATCFENEEKIRTDFMCKADTVIKDPPCHKLVKGTVEPFKPITDWTLLPEYTRGE